MSIDGKDDFTAIGQIAAHNAICTVQRAVCLRVDLVGVGMSKLAMRDTGERRVLYKFGINFVDGFVDACVYTNFVSSRTNQAKSGLIAEKRGKPCTGSSSQTIAFFATYRTLL